MRVEHSSSAAHEQDAPEPYALLQESLGVSAEVARDLASIQVACPDPRGEGSQSSLGEFIASSHGTGKTEQIIDTVLEERRDGTDLEKAMQRALGFAAIKDKDTGKLFRVEHEEEEVGPASRHPATETVNKPNDSKEPPRRLDKNLAGDELDESAAVIPEGTSSELSPEEQAAMHNEVEAEEAEPGVEAEQSETVEELDTTMQQRINEAEIQYHERQKPVVDTATEPEELSVHIPEPVTNEQQLPAQATLINPAPATEITPQPQLRQKETRQPILIVSPKPREAALAPVTLMEDEISDVEVASLPHETVEPSQPPAVLIEENIPLVAKPEGPTPPITPLISEAETVEMTERYTRLQDFAAGLELVLTAETTDNEIIAELLSSHDLTPEVMEIAQQVNEVFLSVSSGAEAEPVHTAVAEVMEAAEQVQLVLEMGEDSAAAKESLEAACEKLLEELQINYDEKIIEEFAQLILLAQEARHINEEQPSVTKQLDQGTHEFKPGQLNVPLLVLRAKQKFTPLRKLGKWALEGSLAAA